MKRSKHTFRAGQRRRFLPLIAVGILALLGIGGAIAYYSDGTIFANIFHLNHYEAEYVETFESPDNWKTCDEVPKTVITKNNSTAPFKVRLSYEEYWRNKEDNANLPLQKDGETLAIINFQNEDDWTLEGNWYYYKQDVQPGESTTSLFKSVTLNCQSNLATNNVCHETENGTVCETPEDDYENAKYHLNITVQTSSEEFSHDNEYYTLTVNPNGGTYKGSSDVYSERILWGTTVDLGSITYTDHELVNWTKNENETHTGTTIRITSDTALKANWQSSLFHNVTVNPNGGTLAGSTDPIVTSVRQGTDYTLTNEEPTREGYLFDGWQLADESMVTNHTFTVMSDITITAKWSLIVAKNERTSTFYRSITAAEAEAQNGDTITLLVDTVEHFTNAKEITLNLGTHTITGSITNNGTLTLLDGEVNNPDGVAVTNNGTFTMGINDFKDNNTVRILPNYVRIIGTTTGLKQNGHFYFYDGFIEGEVGLEGGYDGAPFYRNTFDDTIVYYFPLVDHNWEKDCQHVELAGSDNAVTKTKIGGDIYYYNLQDNINTSERTGYKIYAVRDFDASYTITSDADTEVVFDICGYDITINDTITINGKLTIEDSETTVSTVAAEDNSKAKTSVSGKTFITPHQNNTTTTTVYGGSISVAQTIINNGDFTINSAKIAGYTANDTIQNDGTITMQNGALGATTGYTLQKTRDMILNLDDTSYIYSTSTSKAAINLVYSDLNWGHGNINAAYSAINVYTNSKTSTNPVSISITGGSIHGNTYGIYTSYQSGTGYSCTSKTVSFIGGTITSNQYGTYTDTCTSVTMGSTEASSVPTITVTGTSSAYGVHYSNVFTMNKGSINVNAASTAYGVYLYASNGTAKIIDGDITVKSTGSSAYGFYCPYSNTTLTMTGGNIGIEGQTGGYGIYFTSGTRGTIEGATITATLMNRNSYSGQCYSGYSNNQQYIYGAYVSNTTIKNSTITVTGNPNHSCHHAYGFYATSGDNYIKEGANIREDTAGGFSTAVYNNASLTITGGTIHGEDYGVYTADGKITTIGDNDGEIDIESPEIIGDGYALYNSSTGYFKFYDGVLRGGIKPYMEGVVKEIATDATIQPEQKTIGGIEYDSQYLIAEKYVAQIGNTKYNTLADAIENAGTGTIIEIIADNYIFGGLTIVAEKDFIVNTNGYDFYLSSSIINNGKVSFINAENDETIFNLHGQEYAIINNEGAELNLKNIELKARYGIDNKGTVSLEKLKVTSSNTAVKNTGTAEISGGSSLDASTYPIYNDGTLFKVSNSSIANGYIYNNSGELKLKNSTATKIGDMALEFVTNKGSLEIDSSTITLSNTNQTTSYSDSYIYAAIYNTGTLHTMNNSQLKNIFAASEKNVGHRIATVHNDNGTTELSNTTVILDTTAAYNKTSYNAFAIYSPTGSTTVDSGTITAKANSPVYGIYTDSGTITLGVPEPSTSPNYGRDTADVSTTDPSIEAVSYCATASNKIGVGVKNNSGGKVYFYDGKITALNAPMPERPTGVEYLYEPKDYVDDETGYNYRVLEWMREQNN